uniref:Uncharacterized protein n=1 Tax=Anopheles maculatus TaxID=74869 RepID=A0A182T3D3_9DIPT
MHTAMVVGSTRSKRVALRVHEKWPTFGCPPTVIEEPLRGWKFAWENKGVLVPTQTHRIPIIKLHCQHPQHRKHSLILFCFVYLFLNTFTLGELLQAIGRFCIDDVRVSSKHSRLKHTATRLHTPARNASAPVYYRTASAFAEFFQPLPLGKGSRHNSNNTAIEHYQPSSSSSGALVNANANKTNEPRFAV